MCVVTYALHLEHLADAPRTIAREYCLARDGAVPSRGPEAAHLVPRTRSSRISCREFDRELRVQRGTRIIELLVVLDSEVRKRGCRTNDANFGNRTTSSRRHEFAAIAVEDSVPWGLGGRGSARG